MTHRAQLLAAAPELAMHYKLEQLDAAVIASAAQLDPDQFHASFGSVDEYLLEMHQQFMNDILARILAGAGSLPPGLDRILRSTFIQLDYCLEHRALRALVAQARRLCPRVAEVFHKRNQTTAMMIGMELKNLGYREPINLGRYYCMLVLEAAQIESDAAAAVPEARALLEDFLVLRRPAALNPGSR